MTLEELVASQPTDNHPGNLMPDSVRKVIAYLNDISNGVKALVPIGSGKIYFGGAATVPYGWHICDGTALSRTDYAELFAVLSTTYGAGDGSTTFNLPNLQRRFPLGAGGTKLFTADTANGQDSDWEVNNTLGAIGGEERHQILFNELPNWEMPVMYDHDWTAAFGWGSDLVGPKLDTSGGNITGGLISGDSDEIYMNLLPPSLVVNYIIRVK